MSFRIRNFQTSLTEPLIREVIGSGIETKYLKYKESDSEIVYTITAYSPTSFSTTSIRSVMFMNNQPNMPETATYDESVHTTLPENAVIKFVKLTVINTILPIQEPYQPIMIGFQPISDITPDISGDIISGDSVHFIAGQEYVIDNLPFNRGQYVGGLLPYPRNLTIPRMAFTLAVNFIPVPQFTSGSLKIDVSYILI